jgi:hypothetical protein
MLFFEKGEMFSFCCNPNVCFLIYIFWKRGKKKVLYFILFFKNEKKWSYFNSVINSQKKERKKITKQFLHHISALSDKFYHFLKKKKKNREICGFLF